MHIVFEFVIKFNKIKQNHIKHKNITSIFIIQYFQYFLITFKHIHSLSYKSLILTTLFTFLKFIHQQQINKFNTFYFTSHLTYLFRDKFIQILSYWVPCLIMFKLKFSFTFYKIFWQTKSSKLNPSIILIRSLTIRRTIRIKLLRKCYF